MESIECVVCAETKPADEYPSTALTPNCSHTSSTCHICVSMDVKTQLDTTQGHRLRCPECSQHLGIDAIRFYLSNEEFARYQQRLLATLASRVPNLTWCPFGCGTSHVHSRGAAQPIVQCPTCPGAFCFVHKVAWHADHTCAEYDAYLADPAFRSAAQTARQTAAALRARIAALKRGVAFADEQHQLAVLREGQAAAARAIEAARVERERVEAAERAAREERERRAAEEARLEAERLEGLRLSEATLRAETKPCINPACGVPIMKNGGCMHMTCSRCGTEFHWLTLQYWNQQHATRPWN